MLQCRIVITIVFVLIGSSAADADISYLSLEYGVPAQIQPSSTYVYFNTTLDTGTSFLVLYDGAHLCATRSNPAPNGSNCDFWPISRTKTNTLEIWIPFAQQGQILYVAALPIGGGSLTLSAPTDLDSLPVNSMNLTTVDVQIPPHGQIWFQYKAPLSNAQVFWFYPVLWRYRSFTL